MNRDQMIWIVVGALFLAVATITLIVGMLISQRGRVKGRLLEAGSAAGTGGNGGIGLTGKVLQLDDRIVGLDPEARTKLRMEMIAAGYFSPDAPKLFVIVRAAFTFALPLIGIFVVAPLLGGFDLPILIGGYVLLTFLGYSGPDAFIQRRKRLLVQDYQSLFPDFLDLLVVCVDAGLGLDAALNRIGSEFINQSRAFGANLALLSSEMRAGRGTTEALFNLSQRLNLPEAKSFAMLLRQSIELGTDISDALRTYSDEMREKRLVRAETRANVLPVKLIFPMGVFIFPVILIVVLTPALLKMSNAFGKMAGG